MRLVRAISRLYVAGLPSPRLVLSPGAHPNPLPRTAGSDLGLTHSGLLRDQSGSRGPSLVRSRPSRSAPVKAGVRGKTPKPWAKDALFVPITMNRTQRGPLVSSRPLDTSIGPEGRRGTGLQTNPLAFGRPPPARDRRAVNPGWLSLLPSRGHARGRYAADFLLGRCPFGGTAGLGVFERGFTPPFFTGPSCISLLPITHSPARSLPSV